MTIVDFTKKRLDKIPVTYTVVFIHGGSGMSFIVNDVQDSKKDRLAVAKDFENAAISLREEEE